MELVPATSGGSGDSRSIQIDPATRRVANIRTVAVESIPMARTIRAIGELNYDEGSLKTLSAYVDGRLDRLYADYTGVVVEKGDHLALVSRSLALRLVCFRRFLAVSLIAILALHQCARTHASSVPLHHQAFDTGGLCFARNLRGGLDPLLLGELHRQPLDLQGHAPHRGPLHLLSVVRLWSRLALP